MNNIERRYVPARDLRTAKTGSKFTVRGHAATFLNPYSLGPFDEQIDPGAFDRALREDDVRALWNHDASRVLGRTKSGTLRLSKDSVGLLSEIDLPLSAVAEREAIERKDVDQMSFGFSVRPGGDRWEKQADGRELRTILEAELFDVSPVAFPASPHTDLSIAQRSRDSWRTRGGPTANERERRLRLMELEHPSAQTPPKKRAAPLTPRARQRHLEALRASLDLGRPGDKRSRSEHSDTFGGLEVSLHEAGHAVAAVVRGHDFTSISIDGGSGAIRAAASVLEDPVVSLAGAVAEGFVRPAARPSASDRRHLLAGAEHQAARETAHERMARPPVALRGPPGPTTDAHLDRVLEDTEAEARRILRRYRDALFAVARELRRRGRLTAAEVRRIMARHRAA